MDRETNVTNDDDILKFHDEPTDAQHSGELAPFRVLIIDDEEEVHRITELVLRDFEFEGRGLRFLHAHSAAKARQILGQDSGVAVVFLDVVMEDRDTGLNLVQWIREELKNKMIRIILRTGQPGIAPEKHIIMRYDINDYKEKTELTDTKLWTCLTVALRGFHDLQLMNRSRIGLEKILSSSILFFERQSMQEFFEGVLTQLESLLRADEESMLLKTEGLAIAGKHANFKIVSATGRMHELVGRSLDDIESQDVKSLLLDAIHRKSSIFQDHSYATYMESDGGAESVIYFRSPNRLDEESRAMVERFAGAASLAFENIATSKDVEETQAEMIFTLGDVIEMRGLEKGHHVRKVSQIALIIAEALGYNARELQVLRQAVPLHDIGKIAVMEEILSKPGRLDADQLVEMRKHTTAGYNLLREGGSKALQLAASIALTHHEYWNGRGYPSGLSGTDIPLEGRITAIADVFDALCASRIYKPAWTFENAVTYMRDHSGSQFDPRLVGLLLEHLDELRRIVEDRKD